MYAASYPVVPLVPCAIPPVPCIVPLVPFAGPLVPCAVPLVPSVVPLVLWVPLPPKVKLWDFTNRQQKSVHSFFDHTDSVSSVAFGPDG